MAETNVQTFQDVAAAIARQIIVARSNDDVAFIRLPFRYPSGSTVVTRVARASTFRGEPDKFIVSDYALGYDEAKMMGAGRIYARQGNEIAEREEIEFSHHAFAISDVDFGQLPSAVVLIANCSCEATTVAALRVEESQHQEEGDILYKRLVSTFSPRQVARDAIVTGSSSTKWQVDALVSIDEHRTAFEAVSRHRNSIYAATTKFHDIAALEDAPNRVAVVHRKSELETMLAVLSQAARVVERNVPTETLRRLAGEQASDLTGITRQPL